MGRTPCCEKTKVKRGTWSPEEDAALKNYVGKYGTGGNWIALPQKAGLKRCGKSCRLRWLNYLRPDIKHGGFTEEEDNIILTLYTNIGSRWSVIASQLPGRTDNDVKNYWNTKLKKKLLARTTGAVSAINPTTIIPINNSNSNNFATNPTDFSLATSMAPLSKVQGNYYGNSTNYPIMSFDTLPYSADLIQGYPEIIPDYLLYESSTADHEFALPGLMEVQENGTPQNGFTTSSSQEISSLSTSYSLAKSYASWNDNGVGEEVGFFMELESKSSNYEIHQDIQQEQLVKTTEVDDCSLVNYSYPAGSFVASNISDNAPSERLYHGIWS